MKKKLTQKYFEVQSQSKGGVEAQKRRCNGGLEVMRL